MICSFYLSVSWFCLERGSMNSGKHSTFLDGLQPGRQFAKFWPMSCNRILCRSVWKVFFSPSFSPFFLPDCRLVLGAATTILWSWGNKSMMEVWPWHSRTTQLIPARCLASDFLFCLKYKDLLIKASTNYVSFCMHPNQLLTDISSLQVSRLTTLPSLSVFSFAFKQT